MTWWIIAVLVLVGVALLAEERSGILQVGTAAPDFSATLTNGKQIALRDFRGKNPVVLFFYPADFTQGCTREACAFRDRYKALEEAGVVLIGVSRDSDLSHKRFSREYQLYYPLISDTDLAISRAYGVERFQGWIPLPKRVTYVIDQEGVVRAVIHHEIMMERHVTDVQRALKEIKGGSRPRQ